MADNSRRWAEISKRYRTYIKIERRMADNTVQSYMRDLKQFAHFILHHWDISPAKVEPEMIRRYTEWLFSRGMEPTTQARILSGIRCFYNFLLGEELIPSSPAEFIETPKCNRPLPDILTTEEIDRIIGSIDTSTLKGRRDIAMLEVLYSCGLRVSELTSLRISDLFFGEGYIRVVGKGDKQRLVPISRIARDRIQIYMDFRRDSEERARHRGKPQKSNSEFVFLNNRGEQLTRTMIFKIIRQAVDRAGINKNVSPHTFRHSFATHLIEGGASIRQVQELLGHENILTTEIYTHLDYNRLRTTLENHLPIT